MAKKGKKNSSNGVTDKFQKSIGSGESQKAIQDMLKRMSNIGR